MKLPYDWRMSYMGLIKKLVIFVMVKLHRMVNIFHAIAEKHSDLGMHLTVGRHTYGIKPDTIILPESTNPPHVKIGSFCSFAPGVVILANADHNKDFPSTYPFRTLFFSSLKRGKSSGYFNQDVVSRGSIEIGHDVWVGQNAIILSGISIGTGAVIGAGTVVTKDIPPYAIAVGNPARVISFRFPPSIIERLLESRWWELSDENLRNLESYLYSEDIDAFLDKVRTIQNITA